MLAQSPKAHPQSSLFGIVSQLDPSAPLLALANTINWGGFCLSVQPAWSFNETNSTDVWFTDAQTALLLFRLNG